MPIASQTSSRAAAACCWQLTCIHVALQQSAGLRAAGRRASSRKRPPRYASLLRAVAHSAPSTPPPPHPSTRGTASVVWPPPPLHRGLPHPRAAGLRPPLATRRAPPRATRSPTQLTQRLPCARSPPQRVRICPHVTRQLVRSPLEPCPSSQPRPLSRPQPPPPCRRHACMRLAASSLPCSRRVPPSPPPIAGTSPAAPLLPATAIQRLGSP